MFSWMAIAVLFAGMFFLFCAVGGVARLQERLHVDVEILKREKDENWDLRRRVQELERQLSGEGCRSEFAEPSPVPRLRLPGRPS